MYARFAGIGVGHEIQHTGLVPTDMPENDNNEDSINGNEADVGCTGLDMDEAQDSNAPSSNHEGESNDKDDSLREEEFDGTGSDRDSSDEHDNSEDGSDDDEAVDTTFVF